MGGLRRTEIIIMAVIASVTAVAGALTYGPGASVTSFAFAALSLAGVAWVVSFATEQLGERMGPAATGLLQSTLGNLPEFFVVVFALRAGETVVASTSIIGSIFANALLVLGLAIFAGARAADDGVMRFSPRLPNDTATLMLLSVFIIVMIGVSGLVNDHAARHAQEISVIGSVALLAVYATWVLDYVRRGAREQPSHGEARVSLPVTLALLALGGLGAAFISEWFIEGLEPAMVKLNISEAFAGLVVVAIAGNAIENATGVVLAAKGQSDLAVSVVKNSVAQIAVFLFPLLVLVSLLFENHLTFQLPAVWIAALALTAIIQWQVTGDGEAPAWEGVALVAFYVILGAVALYE